MALPRQATATKFDAVITEDEEHARVEMARLEKEGKTVVLEEPTGQPGDDGCYHVVVVTT